MPEAIANLIGNSLDPPVRAEGFVFRVKNTTSPQAQRPAAVKIVIRTQGTEFRPR